MASAAQRGVHLEWERAQEGAPFFCGRPPPSPDVWKSLAAKQKLEKVMAEKNRWRDDAPLLEDDNELPPVTADTPEEAREKAARRRNQGAG